MQKSAGAAFNVRARLSSSSGSRQEGQLTSYCQVVNYLLPTYAADVIIAEADLNIVNLKQPAGQSAVEYVQAVWKEALCCGPVYKEYRLKGKFIEGLKR